MAICIGCSPKNLAPTKAISKWKLIIEIKWHIHDKSEKGRQFRSIRNKRKTLNLCAFRNSNVSHKSHSSWTGPKQTFAQSLQIIILDSDGKKTRKKRSVVQQNIFTAETKILSLCAHFDDDGWKSSQESKEKNSKIKCPKEWKEYVWKSLYSELSETVQKKGRPTNEQRKSHGKITISNGLRARERTTKRRE